MISAKKFGKFIKAHRAFGWARRDHLQEPKAATLRWS